jgi:tRNA-splicing ligase RtcB
MTEAPLHTWIYGPLPPGVREVLLRLCRTEGVTQVAVMPDVHLSGEFCVGTAVASDRFLFPHAVGGDIGCGMLALAFDGAAGGLSDPAIAARVLGELQAGCPARRHHRRTAHDLPEELRALTLSDGRLQAQLFGEDCRTQLGTLGAGNHFLELQRDADGRLWLMLHTGSRHLGQCVHHHHLPKARKLGGGIHALAADSPEGRAYLQDVRAARLWARANRRLLALRAAAVVERLLGALPVMHTLVDCDHNHVEESAGRLLHRKGATSAQNGEPGVIPGSMGTESFHTRGAGCAEALCSSSHGAGRALSRAEARDRITVSALRQQLRRVWYDARLERQLREEAPGAYKDVDRVMRAQTDLTNVVRRLRPVLVHKGV